MKVDNTYIANLLYRSVLTSSQGFDFMEVLDIVYFLDESDITLDDDLELSWYIYNSMEEALHDQGYENEDEFDEQVCYYKSKYHVIVIS